ncbi:hypothetical protein E8E11_006624 [Didymella keratinophila]|nr:hypothetical protein E8E11_006624 [Didymella keratinophila]
MTKILHKADTEEDMDWDEIIKYYSKRIGQASPAPSNATSHTLRAWSPAESKQPAMFKPHRQFQSSRLSTKNELKDLSNACLWRLGKEDGIECQLQEDWFEPPDSHLLLTSVAGSLDRRWIWEIMHVIVEREDGDSSLREAVTAEDSYSDTGVSKSELNQQGVCFYTHGPVEPGDIRESKAYKVIGATAWLHAGHEDGVLEEMVHMGNSGPTDQDLCKKVEEHWYNDSG